MAIVLTCECGRKLQIKDEFAGQEGQCPACGSTLLIPLTDAPAKLPPLATAAVPVAESVEETPQADAVLTNHGGDQLPADADFFADPPTEIGPLLSAHSTLRKGKTPMTLAARLLLVAGCGLVGLVVGVIIVFISSPREQFWQAFWPLLLAGIAIASAAIRSGFAHTCTYVGRQGVARFACKGGREKVTCEVFRFRDATELRTAQTLRYVNGVYQNTTYSFDWSDVGGRTRYTISGSHRSQSGNPPSTDAYHFARAAEFAWTYYLLENEYRQIELAGSVAFNLKGGRWLRLLPKGIYFSLGGETVEWDAGDIAAAQIEKGVVRIKRNDAREGWFSSTGVMKFPFSDVANAQLFFHLLEKLVGVRVV